MTTTSLDMLHWLILVGFSSSFLSSSMELRSLTSKGDKLWPHENDFIFVNFFFLLVLLIILSELAYSIMRMNNHMEKERVAFSSSVMLYIGNDSSYHVIIYVLMSK